MTTAKNTVQKVPRKFRKKTIKKEQLQNIISLRVDDNEKRTLEKLAKTTSKNISTILREAIDLWKSKRRELCLD